MNLLAKTTPRGPNTLVAWAIHDERRIEAPRCHPPLEWRQVAIHVRMDSTATKTRLRLLRARLIRPRKRPGHCGVPRNAAGEARTPL
jgi:hypothetical protein